MPSTIISPAVTYSARGGPDVIAVMPRSVRPPDAGEVRIRVAAAAVNPTDILLRDPGHGDTPPPLTPGMDAAGTIEAVGAGVDRLTVGQEVMAALTPLRADGGAQAGYIVLPAASVVRKPSNVTLAEAATIPMTGLTALFALDLAGLSSGQTLAVSGGAGWLAYLTIVLARRHGLRIVADAKSAEIDLVRRYGADIVIERSTDFAGAVRRAIPQGVDALLDTAVLDEAAFPALRDGGVYIPVRGWNRPPAPSTITVRPVMVPNVLDRTDWLETLRDLVEARAIVPRIAGEYRLDQVAEAQRLLMAGGVRGRPVLLF